MFQISLVEGKPRQRISYNRKTSQLPLIEDKLLFILVYLKTNTLQEVQAVHFEMTQPQANFWIHLLAKILSKTLWTLGELPDRNSKRVVHLLSECEDVLLDGTERPIVRPCQEDRQASCYSGKTHKCKEQPTLYP